MLRPEREHGGGDPADLIDCFARLALDTTRADVVAVFLRDDERGALFCQSLHAASGVAVPDVASFPVLSLGNDAGVRLPGFDDVTAAPIATPQASVGFLVGGWLEGGVPEAAGRTIADLARALALSLDVVVGDRLELVLAEEREHLAQELLETATRVLSAVNLRAGLLRLVVEEDLGEDVRAVESLARRGLSALGRGSASIAALRPEPADLARSVTAMARAFEECHPARVSVDVRGAALLPDGVQAALLRVAQEAISNVERHAEAQTVSIALDVDAGEAVLRVRDDGLGLRAESDAPVGVGLALACDAVEPLGGVVELRDAEPGTELVARVPLRTPATSLQRLR